MRSSYDTRIRELVARTGNPNVASEYDIPRSTRDSWVRRGPREVIGLQDDFDQLVELHARVAKLERQASVLRALLRLTLTTLRVCGFRLEMTRVAEGDGKQALLHAVAKARAVLPLPCVLKVLRLSSSRYHAWVQASHGCDLTDQSSCPQAVPHRMAAPEIGSMKSMVLSAEFRHMSIRALALHAQRVGRVFAHPTTWMRLIRERGWKRPRLRVYPAKPKVGVRAARPNEAWHVDTTIIRLLDGTRAYLHAAIDNYSRKILAWTVADKMTPQSTYTVLREACGHLPSDVTKVIMDSGIENVNSTVDALFDGTLLERILAQVDVTYSNSMIEAWWRSLRHQWLYLHSLDSIATVRRLTAFYAEQHNCVMPHSAFEGQTPDEMFFGEGQAVPEQLATERLVARRRRIEANRSQRCGRCLKPGRVDVEGVAA